MHVSSASRIRIWLPKRVQQCTAALVCWCLYAAYYSSATHEISTRSNRNSLPNSRPIVYIDEHVLKNVRSYWQGAHACVNCSRDFDYHGLYNQQPARFAAKPLMATVDRRPSTLRRQLVNALANETNIGCAVSTNTMVTGVGFIDVSSFKALEKQAKCRLCFEFSSATYATSFLLEMNSREVVHPSTICIPGAADLYQRFAKWQQGSRNADTAYPWTVDCTFPGGGFGSQSTLSCHRVSEMRDSNSDVIQRIYVMTNFTLKELTRPSLFHVVSVWPWDALRSHGDERSYFNQHGTLIGMPTAATELNLAYIQGPNYQLDTPLSSKIRQSLDSGTNKKVGSIGGGHTRLVIQILQLSLSAKGTTMLLAVPDSQAQATLAYVLDLVEMPLDDVIPTFSNALTHAYFQLLKKCGKCPTVREALNGSVEPSPRTQWRISLSDLMRLQQIQLCIVPLPTPAIAFDRLLISGQYAFSSYIVARYSADYHAMMYFDGDAAPILSPNTNSTLLDLIYRTLYRKNCDGVQFSLVELSIPNRDSSPDRILQCIRQFYRSSDKDWRSTVSSCKLSYGNILGRTDVLRALSVHYVDTYEENLNSDVVGCAGKDFMNDDMLLDESVELHLTAKQRPPTCTCNITT